jgi:hypothetical protein
MNFKDLQWKPTKYSGDLRPEYRADVSIKGLVGIRFQYGKRASCSDSYYYSYIINGKKFGDYLGFTCDDLEQGKRLCEYKYIEICHQIINSLFV